jgi:hypothetical protein
MQCINWKKGALYSYLGVGEYGQENQNQKVKYKLLIAKTNWLVVAHHWREGAQGRLAMTKEKYLTIAQGRPLLYWISYFKV